MLLTNYISFFLLFELVLLLFITGFCLKGGDSLAGGVFLAVLSLLGPILIFEDVTFKNVFPYLPYYGVGILLWFFIKWFLTLWDIGSKLKQEKPMGDKLKYHTHIDIDKDGNYHIKQPEFGYLFMHAVLFPFSIIATFFDNILLRLFNLFRTSMQKFADSFLPKDLKVEKTK